MNYQPISSPTTTRARESIRVYKQVTYGNVYCTVMQKDNIVYINLTKLQRSRNDIYKFLNSLRGQMLVHEFKFSNGLEHEPWEIYRKTLYSREANFTYFKGSRELRHEYNVIWKQQIGPNIFRGTYVREELAVKILKIINDLSWIDILFE